MVCFRENRDNCEEYLSKSIPRRQKNIRFGIRRNGYLLLLDRHLANPG